MTREEKKLLKRAIAFAFFLAGARAFSSGSGILLQNNHAKQDGTWVELNLAASAVDMGFTFFSRFFSVTEGLYKSWASQTPANSATQTNSWWNYSFGGLLKSFCFTTTWGWNPFVNYVTGKEYLKELIKVIGKKNLSSLGEKLINIPDGFLTIASAITTYMFTYPKSVNNITALGNFLKEHFKKCEWVKDWRFYCTVLSIIISLPGNAAVVYYLNEATYPKIFGRHPAGYISKAADVCVIFSNICSYGASLPNLIMNFKKEFQTIKDFYTKNPLLFLLGAFIFSLVLFNAGTVSIGVKASIETFLTDLTHGKFDVNSLFGKVFVWLFTLIYGVNYSLFNAYQGVLLKIASLYFKPFYKTGTINQDNKPFNDGKAYINVPATVEEKVGLLKHDFLWDPSQSLEPSKAFKIYPETVKQLAKQQPNFLNPTIEKLPHNELSEIHYHDQKDMPILIGDQEHLITEDNNSNQVVILIGDDLPEEITKPDTDSVVAATEEKTKTSNMGVGAWCATFVNTEKKPFFNPIRNVVGMLVEPLQRYVMN